LPSAPFSLSLSLSLFAAARTILACTHKMTRLRASLTRGTSFSNTLCVFSFSRRTAVPRFVCSSRIERRRAINPYARLSPIREFGDEFGGANSGGNSLRSFSANLTNYGGGWGARSFREFGIRSDCDRQIGKFATCNDTPRKKWMRGARRGDYLRRAPRL